MRYIIFCTLLISLLNQNAYAYLDGNTGSMLLQLLFGGVAGGWFIIKMYWSKIKLYFFKPKLDETNVVSPKNSTEESK